MIDTFFYLQTCTKQALQFIIKSTVYFRTYTPYFCSLVWSGIKQIPSIY